MGDLIRVFVCSFCGKNHHQVNKMITGYNVYICNECVDLCAEILKKEQDNKSLDTDGKEQPQVS